MAKSVKAPAKPHRAAKSKATKPKPAPKAATPTLRELQAAFQRAVMSGDDAVLENILDSTRTDRGVLFGVYRHAYASRLVEVVRNDHPLLAGYLGDEKFERLARAYIAARPSHTQNARWFAHGLPEFLADLDAEPAEIAELAALERVVNDVFDATDGPVLTIADLAAIAPEAWASLVFSPHPSAHRLDLETNAYAIWAALRDGTLPPAASRLAEPDRILAWRRDVTPMLRRLGVEEAMMWHEAGKGVRFGVLCELIATYDDPEGAALRAARHLQGWIAAGLLSAATAAISDHAAGHTAGRPADHPNADQSD